MNNVKNLAIRGAPTERNSNLELLRIITMLLIIAHHMVVNSGVTELFDYSSISANMLFLQLWGMWGKTAINIFVIISGYFMCTSTLTVKRFGKIYLEAKGYRTVIFCILLLAGYESVGLKRLFMLIFGNWQGAGNGFTASFLMFYLFIPFYNVLIRNLNKLQHSILVGLLLFFYTITGTFFFNRTLFSEPVWYFVLYMLAAYIRKYPMKWMSNNKICGMMLLGSIILSYLSVVAIDLIGLSIGVDGGSSYYMVSDSNKFMAVVVSVSAFLFFNNLKIQVGWINEIARTTFGVFLIHTSGNSMRIFLWKDLLNIPGAYSMNIGALIGYSVVVVFGIFITCSLIDTIRIGVIEKPLLKWLDKFKFWNRELW